MIYDFSYLYDYAILGLRLIVAIVFFSSGLSHVKEPKKRGESIGLPPTQTSILGSAEIIGAISIALGVYIQIGGLILIIAMLGAIYKKIFKWKIGFYADKGFGWHYDLIFLLSNIVIVTHPGTLLLFP